MAIYTAGDQITRALRLLGVLAEGETSSASVMQDSLMAMNQMIDSWNTERLSVFCTQDQTFTWPAGQITRTLGPSGNFIGLRPILLDEATYFRDPGTNVSFGIKFINQQQYVNVSASHFCKHDLPRRYDDDLPAAHTRSGMAFCVGARTEQPSHAGD